VASVDGGGSPTRVTNGALVHGFCWGSRQNEEWAMAKLTSLISWAGGGNMAQSSLDGGGVTPAVHLPQKSVEEIRYEVLTLLLSSNCDER
jgi:hypothetical protein